MNEARIKRRNLLPDIYYELHLSKYLNVKLKNVGMNKPLVLFDFCWILQLHSISH